MIPRVMTNHIVRTAALGAAILAAGLPAQLGVGDQAPEVAFQDGVNNAPQSWKEIQGKLLLLDFFATW